MLFDLYWCGAYYETVSVTKPAGWDLNSNMLWNYRYWVLQETSATCQLSLNSLIPNEGPGRRPVAEVRAYNLGTSSSTPPPPVVQDTTGCPADCEDFLRTTVRTWPKWAVEAGSTLTYKVTIKNTNRGNPLIGMGYAMYVPEGVQVLEESAHPAVRDYHGNKKSAIDPENPLYLYWERFTLGPRKSRTFKVKNRPGIFERSGPESELHWMPECQFLHEQLCLQRGKFREWRAGLSVAFQSCSHDHTDTPHAHRCPRPLTFSPALAERARIIEMCSKDAEGFALVGER